MFLPTWNFTHMVLGTVQTMEIPWNFHGLCHGYPMVCAMVRTLGIHSINDGYPNQEHKFTGAAMARQRRLPENQLIKCNLGRQSMNTGKEQGRKF